MNSKLPESWFEAIFGELNQFISSTIDPTNFSDERFELYSVPSFPTRQPEIVTGIEIGSTKQLLQPDDVLVCKINPRINRVWQVSPKTKYRQIGSSEWIGFRAPCIDTRYFRYYFSSNDFRDVLCADVTGVGGSLTRAQPKKVATFKIPVAPISEQKRIADKLDTVLARVDGCRDRLDRIPAILKRFRQSVLAAAFTGKLTEEWRSEASLTHVKTLLSEIKIPPRPNRYSSCTERIIDGNYALAVGNPNRLVTEGWVWTPLVDIARMETGHTPSRSHPEYWNGDIPWIGIADARDGHARTIQSTYQHTNELGLANSAARLLPEGTICLSRTASVGYVVRMGVPMATSINNLKYVR
jgi:restriction endonuclease S subunit